MPVAPLQGGLAAVGNWVDLKRFPGFERHDIAATVTLREILQSFVVIFAGKADESSPGQIVPTEDGKPFTAYSA